MNEKTKPNKQSRENPPAETEDAAWQDDRRSLQYYYDDACGYEIYSDENEDEELSEMPAKSKN